MPATSIVSPDDQKVTFIELFFDLVFVFCVTQVVGLLHHGVTWPLVGQAVLVFWLVWWAWTQFTWALNAADTTHHRIELGTLLATAVAFFLAVSIPNAFAGGELWFAITYVVVRSIGLLLYIWVARAADPGQHAAVWRFTVWSSTGLIAVLLGGVLGGAAQYWCWGIAILLDVIAAAVGARSDKWNLHPEHFAERHGLFVIIALGETLIVAAGGFAGAVWDVQLITVAMLAVGIAGAFWWCYFTHAKPAFDHALEAAHGAHRSELARDAGSLLHFPMLLGIIAYAVAVADAIAHPHDAFALTSRLALAIGLLFFVAGMALTLWRALRQVLVARIVLTLLTAAAVLAVPAPLPAVSLGIALLGVTAVAVWEQRALPELLARRSGHMHPTSIPTG